MSRIEERSCCHHFGVIVVTFSKQFIQIMKNKSYSVILLFKSLAYVNNVVIIMIGNTSIT